MSNISADSGRVLLSLYETLSTTGSESGEIEDHDLANAANLATREVYAVMEDLQHLGLVSYIEKEGPGPEPRIFFQYQIMHAGMQKAKSLRRNSMPEHQNSQNNSILEKVDIIDKNISAIQSNLNSLTQKVDRLESAIEDKSYLRPKFVESSPGNRTFGKEVEGVLGNILQSQSKNMEIFIMGYFDHDSLDKLKQILAAKGKVRMVHPELTTSKQDQGNLDAPKTNRKKRCRSEGSSHAACQNLLSEPRWATLGSYRGLRRHQERLFRWQTV